MRQISNFPRIKKGILSFSHDRVSSREKADQLSISKAEREIASGKKGISHLILRAEDDSIDRLKFLFLIHGIPLMCYALANLLNSSIEEIVVVGSREVEKVLNLYEEINGFNGKTVHFASEDLHNLSMIHTLTLGREKLSLDSDELVLFQPGDLPFLYDLEKVLQDKDIKSNDLILWLNARQKMFPGYEEDPDSEFVQRNYHYRAILEDENVLLDVKEPNIYPVNLSRLDTDMIDRLHSSRKDGQILNAGISNLLKMPIKILRILPVVLYHLKHFKSDVHSIRPNDQYQFGSHQKNFHKGLKIILGTTALTKFHDDPAFVSDVDALEDWEDFESMIHKATQQFGPQALIKLHPAGEELLRFKQQGMEKLKSEIPMYANFPAFTNDIYHSQKMGRTPFDANGNYQPMALKTRQDELAVKWYQNKCHRATPGGN